MPTIFFYANVVVLWFFAMPVQSQADVFGAGGSEFEDFYSVMQRAYLIEEGGAYIRFTGSPGPCKTSSTVKTCGALHDLEQGRVTFATSTCLLPGYDTDPGLQVYPAMGFAVVPIYNLGNNVDLVLSEPVLAQIFDGTIRYWDDARILTLNPEWPHNLTANQPIDVVLQRDGSCEADVFRKYLATFDRNSAAFENATGTSVKGAQQVNSHVLLNKFSIGYTILGQAMAHGQAIAKFKKGSTVLTATSDGVKAAILEIGDKFKGGRPDQPVADIYGARGYNSWPISSYSYLFVRKDRMRTGSCGEVLQMMKFVHWMWNSPTASSLAKLHHIGMLPSIVKMKVMTMFLLTVQCNGSKVWNVSGSASSVLTAFGIPGAEGIIRELGTIYGARSSIKVGYQAPVPPPAAVPGLLDAEGLVVADSPTRAVSGSPDLIFAAVGIVAVSRMKVTLNTATLARILDGTVTTWLDDAITALNPEGLVDEAGVRLTDPTQPIILLQGPTCVSHSVSQLLKRHSPSYSGAAIKAAPSYSTEDSLVAAVSGTPYSLSLTVITTKVDLSLQVALQGSDGARVRPSLDAIESCFAEGDGGNGTTPLWHPEQAGCYPLVTIWYLNAKRQACNDAVGTGLDFLRWMTAPQAQTLLRLNHLLPLHDVSPWARSRNLDALQVLLCQPEPVILSHGLPLALVTALGCGVLAACAAALWFMIRRIRALRRQFSNQNIVNSFVEAIAMLDFEAIAWVYQIPKPNAMQRSLITIAHMLSEVRPFLPDHVLMLCRRMRHDAFYDLPDADSPPSTSRTVDTAQTTATIDRHSSHLGLKRHLAPDQLGTRRCTYMCVKRRLAGSPSGDELDQEYCKAVNRRTSDIIQTAKAFGATIENVRCDTVTMHWGVTEGISTTDAALQAVQAALRIAHADDALSELHISIAHGKAQCGTIFTEGMAFFVLSSVEIQECIEQAHSDSLAKYQCPVLISQSVYEKVRHTARCFPRALHGNAVLWQPLQIRAQDSESDGEWMYQLHENDDGKQEALKGESLLPLFRMAADKKKKEDLNAIKDRYWEIKYRYRDDLTSHDVLCLDTFIESLPH